MVTAFGRVIQVLSLDNPLLAAVPFLKTRRINIPSLTEVKYLAHKDDEITMFLIFTK